MTLLKSVNNAVFYKFSIRGLSSLGTSSQEPIVDLPGLGKIQGQKKNTPWTNREFYQFLGVKYGESPSGEKRFKLPVPVKPWEGVIKATKYGLPSPTIRSVMKTPKEQFEKYDLEDCLNLCVFTNDLSAKKPVIVYIHGGGFFEGAAYQHPGDYFAEKDVVLVVPQFRLGPLGFLTTLSDTLPGNAGVFDVILALEWVKNNISQFGGDPNSVTLLGQSAGGVIASTLLYSPIVPPDLFNKIILQSGQAVGTWTYDVNPIKKAKIIANRCGIDKKASIEDIEKAFMKMDLPTLMTGFMTHLMKETRFGADKIGGHRIVIGGPSNLLPKTPFELMRAGEFRKNIPMIIGCVQNEGSFPLSDVCDLGYSDSTFDSVKMLEDILMVTGIHDISASYIHFLMKELFTPEQLKRGIYKEMAGGFLDIAGTILVKGGILRAAQQNAKSSPNETYLYTFDYKGEHTRWGYQRDVSYHEFDGGVYHTNEITYMFPWPTAMSKLNERDRKFANQLIDLWVSFATTGKPTSSEVKEWPAFKSINGPYLHLDKEFNVGNNFFDEFTVNSRQYTESGKSK